jgi:V/A-type H+-transporting ATPase subunit E
MQLQELLEKIKKDGVDVANSEASRVRAEAEAEAKRIVDDADKRAKELVEKARLEAERYEASAKAAVTQASRTLLIAFKEQVQTIVSAIVAKSVEQRFDAELMGKAIVTSVQALSKAEGIEVHLSEKDAAAMKGAVLSELSKKLPGTEIKPSKSVRAGFRIVEKNGAAYYDYSAEAVADMLSAYLNAETAELMRNAAGGA